jgi:hypothetical protein
MAATMTLASLKIFVDLQRDPSSEWVLLGRYSFQHQISALVMRDSLFVLQLKKRVAAASLLWSAASCARRTLFLPFLFQLCQSISKV